MSFYRVGDVGILFAQGGPYSVDFSSGDPGAPVGGQQIDIYTQYHSLHNHSHPPSAQHAGTRVANWVQRMASQAPNGGNSFTIGATFTNPWEWAGQAPLGTATHEETTNSPYCSSTVRTWENKDEIELVQYLPYNFEMLDYDPDVASNLGASIQQTYITHFTAWETNAPNPNRRYSIYTSWPETRHSGTQTSDLDSLTTAQRNQWFTYAFGYYQDWMELLASRIQAAMPGIDLRLHNINLAVMGCIRDTVVGTIPLSDLFEDVAPHGRSTIYFIAGVAEYIEIFNEKPPANFQFNSTEQADPARRVHQTAVDNYQTIVDYVWGVLRP